MPQGSIIMRRTKDEKDFTGSSYSTGKVIAIHPSNWRHRLSMRTVNFRNGKDFRIYGGLLDALNLDPYRLTKITVSTKRFPYSDPFYMTIGGSLGTFSKITYKGKSYHGPCARFWRFLLGKEIRVLDIMWVRAERINPTKEGD